jgi:hypothetical protein
LEDKAVNPLYRPQRFHDAHTTSADQGRINPDLAALLKAQALEEYTDLFLKEGLGEKGVRRHRADQEAKQRSWLDGLLPRHRRFGDIASVPRE